MRLLHNYAMSLGCQFRVIMDAFSMLLSPSLVTFPKIYQRKSSCVNDVSTMTDVSVTPVYSGCVLSIFCLFSVFFSVFSPFVCKKIILHFLCLFWLRMFLRTNSCIFRCDHCQLYDCMLGIQDGGSKFKMAALWRNCDVMKRHNRYVINPIC